MSKSSSDLETIRKHLAQLFIERVRMPVYEWFQKLHENAESNEAFDDELYDIREWNNDVAQREIAHLLDAIGDKTVEQAIKPVMRQLILISGSVLASGCPGKPTIDIPIPEVWRFLHKVIGLIAENISASDFESRKGRRNVFLATEVALAKSIYAFIPVQNIVPLYAAKGEFPTETKLPKPKSKPKPESKTGKAPTKVSAAGFPEGLREEDNLESIPTEIANQLRANATKSKSSKARSTVSTTSRATTATLFRQPAPQVVSDSEEEESEPDDAMSLMPMRRRTRAPPSVMSGLSTSVSQRANKRAGYPKSIPGPRSHASEYAAAGFVDDVTEVRAAKSKSRRSRRKKGSSLVSVPESYTSAGFK